MASVGVQTTESALAGDHVEALIWHLNHPQKFEAPVGPFGLVDDKVKIRKKNAKPNTCIDI
jgi:hypothetical protein